jgi:prolyl-tRNA editing enzyme YbaK/EbsC (Cys-tRNA(Pro) deacylase)
VPGPAWPGFTTPPPRPGLAIRILKMAQSTRTAQEAAEAAGCEVARSSNRWCSKTRRQAASPCCWSQGAHNADMDFLSERYGLILTRCEVRRVRDETGFAIGGVAPIGHLRPITVHMDRSLMDHAVVWAAAGRPDSVFSVDPKALAKSISAEIIDVQPRPSRLIFRALLSSGWSAANPTMARIASLCSPRAGTGPGVASGHVENAERELPAAHRRCRARRHVPPCAGRVPIAADQGQGPRKRPTPRKALPNGREAANENPASNAVWRGQASASNWAAKTGSSLRAKARQELSVEFRFQALHRDETAIGAGVATAPVRPVKQASATLHRHATALSQGHQQVHHVGRPVDNCRIDHATATAGARGQHACKHAHCEIKRTAANISNKRRWCKWRLALDWPSTRPHRDTEM